MEKMSYEWIRSNRKTMSIQIKEDGRVIVRSPYNISRIQVETFLSEKQGWIKKQLDRIEKTLEEEVVITQKEREQGMENAVAKGI